jgi:hypothetical protein
MGLGIHWSDPQELSIILLQCDYRRQHVPAVSYLRLYSHVRKAYLCECTISLPYRQRQTLPVHTIRHSALQVHSHITVENFTNKTGKCHQHPYISTLLHHGCCQMAWSTISVNTTDSEIQSA